MIYLIYLSEELDDLDHDLSDLSEELDDVDHDLSDLFRGANSYGVCGESGWVRFLAVLFPI